MNKFEFLDAAREAITDRDGQYGDAYEFARIAAALWSPVLGVQVAEWQVIACLGQMKVARITVNPTHTDSHVDNVGYAAILGEVGQRGKE